MPKITLEPHIAEEVDNIVRTRFNINPSDTVVSFELILRKHDPVKYENMRQSFVDALAATTNPQDVLLRSYVGPEFALHLECVYPRSEIVGIKPEMARHYPVCTRDEILRMQNPRSAQDQLLLMRANAIADNSRLKRVFLRRRAIHGPNWSLTSYFSREQFQRYLNSLPQATRKKCVQAPAGFAFLREPNGACISTGHGNIIVISEALEKYLYFMNLFLLDFEEIPKSDRFAALTIASRTMLLLESPDFDLDPRGRLPRPVHLRLKSIVDIQMQFVIGHEYGHLSRKHLGKSISGNSSVGVLPSYMKNRYKFYTRQQTQEIAADRASLLDPDLGDGELLDRLNGAVWFFLGLEVFYGIMRFLKKSVEMTKTHPPPVERIWALYDSVRNARPSLHSQLLSNEQLQNHIDYVMKLKGMLLMEVVPKHAGKFETYGSVYLPSFRRTVLKDRIDY